MALLCSSPPSSGTVAKAYCSFHCSWLPLATVASKLCSILLFPPRYKAKLTGTNWISAEILQKQKLSVTAYSNLLSCFCSSPLCLLFLTALYIKCIIIIVIHRCCQLFDINPSQQIHNKKDYGFYFQHTTTGPKQTEVPSFSHQPLLTELKTTVTACLCSFPPMSGGQYCSIVNWPGSKMS